MQNKKGIGDAPCFFYREKRGLAKGIIILSVLALFVVAIVFFILFFNENSLNKETSRVIDIDGNIKEATIYNNSVVKISLSDSVNLSNMQTLEFVFYDGENEYSLSETNFNNNYEVTPLDISIKNFKKITKVEAIITYKSVLNSSGSSGGNSAGSSSGGLSGDSSSDDGVGDDGGSSSTVNVPVTCVEDWLCSSWSSCVAGTKSRSCSDANSCGSVINRPALSESCEVECVLNCSGKQCGSDGCGGRCGSCGDGYYCDNSNCVESNFSDWYVRPPASLGTYESEDGTSYDSAWNGLLDVVFGPEGVKAGDNLYVCGEHLYSEMVRWKIAASGISDDYPITIRMDCNDKNSSYEKGVLWGHFLSENFGIVWNGPDANGIYNTTQLGWTSSLIQDIDGFNHILLNKASSKDLNGESGTWYRNGTSGVTYLKTTYGGNPLGRVYFQPSDWLRIDLETSSYIRFYKCNIYGFEIRNTAPSVELSPKHITFDGCDIQYGGTLISMPAGFDFWTIKNSELHNAGNGIYTLTPGNMYNLVVENNYIHDIGTSNFYHQDAHGVGVQNGINFIIQNNTFNNTGEAITFWSGNYPMFNNTIRYNFISNVYKKSNTNGAAIVVAGNTASDKRYSYFIYGNIILNPALGTSEDFEGGGITLNIGGDADLHIYNNIIYNEEGSHTNGRGAIRVYNSQGYPLQNVYIYNNIIYNPNYRYIYLYSSGVPWQDVFVDNNIYYPANMGDFSAFVLGEVASHDINSKFIDPKFVSSNPQVPADFKLQAGSPAIDAGILIPGINDNYSGSAPDIGAYEYTTQQMQVASENHDGILGLFGNLIGNIIKSIT